MAILTNTSIDKIAVPAMGKVFLYDEHREAPRGFAIKVTSAGARIFTLRYKVDGRTRLKVIGARPAWTVEAARAEARRLVQGVDQGVDPLEEKRRRRLEPTFAELATDWLDQHASGLASEKAIRGYVLNDLVPVLGTMKVSDVRRRDVIELVEKKAQNTPRAAAQVLLYAKRIMDYATNREVIAANPIAGLKPEAIKVKGQRSPLRAKARSRILDRGEVRAFWHGVEQCGMRRLSALALKLILVTGMRPGEVAGMCWDEIDAANWTIPAHRRRKTDTPHTVHLTATAQHLLDLARAEAKRLRERRGKEWTGGHVFEMRAGKPLTVAGLDRAVERSGMGDWRPHDLRRTMRTGLSACKVRPDIAEMTIGHTKKGIIAVYDLHEFEDERRIAMQAWEAALLAMLNDNVIALELAL